MTWTCGSWSEGLHDLYFTVQWFCLLSWRLFDVCTFGVWISLTRHWPQNKCKSLWPIYSWSSDCALYLEDYFMYQHHYLSTSLFGIMNQYDPTHDLKINVGHFDLYFMVLWLCVISWKLFDVWTLSLGIMGHNDWTFDRKINVCHCDLYIMAQWFCLVSQILFDGWV